MKMKDIVVGMKLEDGRTEEIFTVVEKNSKYKTVLLESEDGNTISTSISTITKHFTEVVDLDDMSTPAEEEVESVEPDEIDESDEDETSVDENDRLAIWKSKKKLHWSEMLSPFIEKDKKVKKKKKRKIDFSEKNLFELLPLETILTSFSTVNIDTGDIVFRVIRKDGKSVIESYDSAINSIKSEKEYDVTNSDELQELINEVNSLVEAVA